MENPQNATTGDQLTRNENPVSFDEIGKIDSDNKDQNMSSSHNPPMTAIKNSNSYYQHSSAYFNSRHSNRRHEDNYNNYHRASMNESYKSYSNNYYNSYGHTGHTGTGAHSHNKDPHTYQQQTPYTSHNSTSLHNAHTTAHRTNSVSYYTRPNLKKNSVIQNNQPSSAMPQGKVDYKKKKRSINVKASGVSGTATGTSPHNNSNSNSANQNSYFTNVPTVCHMSNNMGNNYNYGVSNTNYINQNPTAPYNSHIGHSGYNQYSNVHSHSAQSHGSVYNSMNTHSNSHNAQGSSNSHNLHLQYASKSKKPSVMKKLIFVNQYEKCMDFSGFKNFLNLNLKFLKQNYKFKEEESNPFLNMNNLTMNNMNSKINPLNNLNLSNLGAILDQNLKANNLNQQTLNYLNNLKNMSNMNNMGNMGNANNMNTAQNLYYLQMNIGTFNNITINNPGNNMMNYMQNMQTPTNAHPINMSLDKLDDESNIGAQGLFFFNPYLGNSANKIINSNKSKKEGSNSATKSHNMNMNIYNNNNNNNIQVSNFNPGNNQYNSDDESNPMNIYNLNMQPYTFVNDVKVIEENLKSGRYLKGVIRINKCHTHGYITVEGLDNDILIRGNRNLNQSLHLDEVIVELFPMVCWKPLFNKKVRKTSMKRDNPNTANNNFNFNNTNSYSQSKLQVNTDEEVDTDKDMDQAVQHVHPEDNLSPQKEDSLDDEESINQMKYKENFEILEDRLKYINKVFNLRPEGRIVKIAHSPNSEKNQIVKIVCEKSLIFACPIDETLPKIFIKMKKFRRVEFVKKLENDNYFKNKYFLVKIVGWALNFKCPKGIIVNELGNCGDVSVETEVLLKTYEINYGEDYSPEVMEEVKKYDNWSIEENKELESELLKERVDLRNEIIFTIDPKHSKDLDDAISVNLIDEASGLLEIGVHIADPSHFITKDSLLDKEAINRVTTVYLVHKNIPMLPRLFSENLCSLLPFKDRLAFSLVFRIYYNGALDTTFQPKFFLSIMNSAAKWNYELVQRIIDGEDIKYDDLSDADKTKPKSEEIFNKMVEKVKMLQKLTKLVRSQRIESGSLIIENDEINFTLDYTKNSDSPFPVGFKLKTKADSNNMVEELMLIANKLTAEYLYDNIREYSLIRKHPFLNDNKFLEIQRYLSLNKLIVDFEDPQALNNMLMKIKNNNYNKYVCIQHKLKNFMQRAEYVVTGESDISELRHSALNFDLYTHFTSPIRRYPDLVVHRQLKYILTKGEKCLGEYNKDSQVLLYDKYIDHFNERYINGKTISSKCNKIFHCILLKSMPSLVYKALVIDVNYRNVNKQIKRPGMGMQGNTNNQSNENTAPQLSISIFIAELNLEIVK
jgi:VacB/RNase II family 3'-5' exoribonuclease